MDEDGKYQGWSSYATWAAALWINNDELLQELAAGRVRAAEGSGANELHEFVEELLLPDLGATLAADLLMWAVEQIDWVEIAETLKEAEVTS